MASSWPFEERGSGRSWFIGHAGVGPLFSAVSGRDDSIVQMRIANLLHYLEWLQENKKPTLIHAAHLE